MPYQPKRFRNLKFGVHKVSTAAYAVMPKCQKISRCLRQVAKFCEDQNDWRYSLARAKLCGLMISQ